MKLELGKKYKKQVSYSWWTLITAILTAAAVALFFHFGGWTEIKTVGWHNLASKITDTKHTEIVSFFFVSIILALICLLMWIGGIANAIHINKITHQNEVLIISAIIPLVIAAQCIAKSALHKWEKGLYSIDHIVTPLEEEQITKRNALLEGKITLEEYKKVEQKVEKQATKAATPVAAKPATPEVKTEVVASPATPSKVVAKTKEVKPATKPGVKKAAVKKPAPSKKPAPAKKVVKVVPKKQATKPTVKKPVAKKATKPVVKKPVAKKPIKKVTKKSK